MLRPRDVRSLADPELVQKEADLREELFRLRFRGATGEVENKMKARLARRDLARLLTIRGERTRAAGLEAR